MVRILLFLFKLTSHCSEYFFFPLWKQRHGGCSLYPGFQTSVSTEHPSAAGHAQLPGGIPWVVLHFSRTVTTGHSLGTLTKQHRKKQTVLVLEKLPLVLRLGILISTRKRRSTLRGLASFFICLFLKWEVHLPELFSTQVSKRKSVSTSSLPTYLIWVCSAFTNLPRLKLQICNMVKNGAI